MKKSEREQMYRDIEKHGNNLCRIFKLDTDPVKLCKQLRRLENKAHKLAEDYGNGIIDGPYEFDVTTDKILDRVHELLNATGNYIFVNGDARGYALKIEECYAKDITIYRDMGGYGIIAPDFTPVNV